MRISYRTHPILEKLHKRVLGNMPVFEADFPFFELNGKSFTHNWKGYQPKFIEEINYISKPFLEATKQAWNKLFELYRDIVENDAGDLSISGSFIIGDVVYMIDYHVNKGSEAQEVVFYMFDKNGTPIAFYIDSHKYEIFQNGWISNCTEINPSDKSAIANFIMLKIVDVVIVKMFMSYASVETKYLPAKKKVKEIDCKYLNDTDLNITHLNSTWFTNLVKSDAFKVRGHFRLQPRKNDKGEWTRELIWIKDFEKSGYTAPARKLKQ